MTEFHKLLYLSITPSKSPLAWAQVLLIETNYCNNDIYLKQQIIFWWHVFKTATFLNAFKTNKDDNSKI